MKLKPPGTENIYESHMRSEWFKRLLNIYIYIYIYLYINLFIIKCLFIDRTYLRSWVASTGI